MRKLKLLIAACALLVSAGAQAQSWTAPTLQGETPVSGEAYKIYNVQAEKYLTEGQAWFSWSTTAILATSGSDFIFNGSASDFTLTTVRSGNNLFFTSGDGIQGDAMHVDGWNVNAHTHYGYSQMPDGYYHIHNAGGDAESLCWGYNSSFHATGVVAHADATAEGWMCEWTFVNGATMKLYAARLDLYNLLQTAYAEGVSTDAASDVYNNASATADELIAAYKALNLLRMEKALEGNTASLENPFDVTQYVLTNPDFEVPTPNGQLPPGWNITITGQNCGQQNRMDINPITQLAITNFIEAWHPQALGPGVIAQTVSSLPEGTYILECDASVCHDDPNWDNDGLGYNDGTDIVGAYLFIKSSLKTEQEPLGNRRADIQHYSVSFVHGGTGEVQFGLTADETINANWLSADNFKIFYAGGVDLSVFVAALTEAVATFNALEGVDAAVYASLKTQVNALNKTYSTSGEYQAAIDNVNIIIDYATAYAAATAASSASEYANVSGNEKTALTTAINDAPTYADYTTYAAKTEALILTLANFKAAAPAYNAYASYKAETIALWGTDFNVAAPTSAGECATATQNLNIAQYNKVASDYTFSCTGLIGGFGSWTGTATVGGQPGTPNYLNWEHWSGAEHAYYEQDANGWDNSAGWTIKYVKTCTLPAGSYVIKVAARSSAGVTSKVSCTATETTIALPCAGNNTRGINTSGEASWSDEDTFANTGYYYEHPATEGGTGTGWQWRFLPFTLAEEGEVTMAFEAETNARYQWMSIGDGELLSTTKLARDIVFNEGQENVIENTLIADVTMNRTIKEGYNTVVLPFALTDNQVTAAFGTETEVYNFSEDSPNPMKATINFSKGDGSIIANTPVLVWTTQASEQQTFEGVQIVAPTDGAKVVGTNFDFVGTYNPSTVVDGDYFIGNGALYKSAGATTINAFRAYINTKVQGGEVRMLIDGKEATGISTINRESITNNRYYNLSGQRVDNPKKGLYIVNGRKVVIK